MDRSSLVVIAEAVRSRFVQWTAIVHWLTERVPLSPRRASTGKSWHAKNSRLGTATDGRNPPKKGNDMADLSVDWAGLQLKNPIITAASSLGNHIDKLKRVEDAGAGAVTTKLIQGVPNPPMHEFPYRMVYQPYGWMLTGEQNMSLDQGLELIRTAKEELDIPVIANNMQENVSGVTDEDEEVANWVRDALVFQEAGADALELDLYPVITANPRKLRRVIDGLHNALRIPVMPKIGPGSPVRQTAQNLIDAGVKHFTMGNCLWEVSPGVDIYDGGKPIMEFTEKFNIASLQGPYLFPIQNGFLGQLKTTFGDQADIGTGGGIYTWDQIVQRIMLGGHVVQLCSTIYENGPGIIRTSLDAMSEFMDEQGYETLADFRGLGLNSGITPVPEDPAVYSPAVAHIKDRLPLIPRGREIVEKVSGDCLAMSVGSDGAPVIDDRFCTGCGWCVHHAGDGSIELVETDKWISDLDLPRLSQAYSDGHPVQPL